MIRNCGHCTGSHATVAQTLLCARDHDFRRAPREGAQAPHLPAPEPAREALSRDLLATIPVGDRGWAHYAVRHDGAVDLYQVERPSRGPAAGATFVRPYGERTNLRGAERHRVLTAILADPLGAAGLFGQSTGRCGVCHHGLRVRESLERVVVVDGREVAGVGPKCARKFAVAA